MSKSLLPIVKDMMPLANKIIDNWTFEQVADFVNASYRVSPPENRETCLQIRISAICKLSYMLAEELIAQEALRIPLIEDSTIE